MTMIDDHSAHYFYFQKIPGVVAFFSAKDIPGKNTFTPLKTPFGIEEEEIFATSNVLFHNQPVGVLVGDTFEIANRAANFVDIKYRNGGKIF